MEQINVSSLALHNRKGGTVATTKERNNTMGMVSSSSGLFTLGRNRQEFINAPLRKPDKHKQIMFRSRLFQTSSMKKEEADTCASIS